MSDSNVSSELLCPQCGQPPRETWYERSYGVAPEVAMYRKWDLGRRFARCHFGHWWNW